jgi:hypothetical protein
MLQLPSVERLWTTCGIERILNLCRISARYQIVTGPASLRAGVRRASELGFGPIAGADAVANLRRQALCIV